MKLKYIWKEQCMEHHFMDYANMHWIDRKGDPNLEKNIETEEILERVIKWREELEHLMKQHNKTYEDLETPEHPLFYAIYKFSHPNYIKHLRDVWYNEDHFIMNTTKYDKMPHIYNKELQCVYIKPAIKDILELMYTSITSESYKFKRYCDLSNDFHIDILDKYAKIFEVEYEKISYL
jgi:hypothetical protein